MITIVLWKYNPPGAPARVPPLLGGRGVRLRQIAKSPSEVWLFARGGRPSPTPKSGKEPSPGVTPKQTPAISFRTDPFNPPFSFRGEEEEGKKKKTNPTNQHLRFDSTLCPESASSWGGLPAPPPVLSSAPRNNPMGGVQRGLCRDFTGA